MSAVDCGSGDTRYPPVPAQFLGVWQRTLLEGPGIATDTRATVFWLQTPRWHGDIRLPADRPDFAGCGALADCAPAQRQWIASQKGFAGLTEVTSEPAAPGGPVTYCQWHRLVDFQPARPDRDLGRIVFFDGGAAMDEHGVDAAYRETWVRLPHSVGATGAWRRPAAGFGELLLVAGTCFFYLRDRRRPLPAAHHLCALASDPDAPTLLDMELSFGQWNAAAGTGEIAHSSLPWREGEAFMPAQGWQPA